MTTDVNKNLDEQVGKVLGQTDTGLDLSSDTVDALKGLAPETPPAAPKVPAVEPTPVVGNTPEDVAPSAPADNPLQLAPDTLQALEPGRYPGYMSALGSAVERGWGQAKASLMADIAMVGELAGDTDMTKQYMHLADTFEKEGGDPVTSLKSVIANPEDLGYYLIERGGEQAVNILAMMATGGIGRAATKFGIETMIKHGGLSPAAVKSLVQNASKYIRFGTGVGAYAGTTALETGGTVQEQYGVSGSTQPLTSMTAGAIKGALELVTPWAVTRAISKPGWQFSKRLPGAMGEAALLEGATELAQEEVDIYARKTTDPTYNYFGSEANWRRAESAVAGAVIGGGVGAGVHHIEKKQEAKGSRTDIPIDQIPLPSEQGEAEVEGKVNVKPSERSVAPVEGDQLELGLSSDTVKALGSEVTPKEAVGDEMVLPIEQQIAQMPEEQRRQMEEEINKSPKLKDKIISKWLAATKDYDPEPIITPFDPIQHTLPGVLRESYDGSVPEMGDYQPAGNDRKKTTTQLSIAGEQDLPAGAEEGKTIKTPEVKPLKRMTRGETDKLSFARYGGGMREDIDVPRAEVLTEEEKADGYAHANDLVFNDVYGQQPKIRELERSGYERTYVDPETGQIIVKGVKVIEKPYPRTDEEFKAQQKEWNNTIHPRALPAVMRYVERKVWEQAQGKDRSEVSSKEAISPDQVQIIQEKKQPIPGRVRARVQSDYGVITIEVNPKTKSVRVMNTGLKGEKLDPRTYKTTAPSPHRGQGHGAALYKHLFDWALKYGFIVESDSIVSEDAAHMYRAAQKHGYEVRGLENLDPRKMLLDPDGGFYEAPSASDSVVQVVKGPVSRLREMMLPNGPDVAAGEQIIPTDMRDDAMGIGPVLKSELNRFTTDVSIHEQMLDLLESNTRRYVVMKSETGAYPMAFNATDLEEFTAIEFPQGEQIRIFQINQQTLNLGAVTADIFDLVKPDSSKIWFLPKVTQVEETALRQLYQAMWARLEPRISERLKGAQAAAAIRREFAQDYNMLITAGLRVVPSRGESFMYNGGWSDLKELSHPPKSGRSMEVAYYDPQTGMFNKLREIDPADDLGPIPTPSNPTGLGPVYEGFMVALDMTKFKPGEISALPIRPASGDPRGWLRGQKVQFREGLTKEQQEALLIDSANYLTAADPIAFWRGLMGRGMWLEANPHQTNFVVKAELDERLLVLPYAQPNSTYADIGLDAPLAFKKIQVPFLPLEKSQLNVNVKPFAASTEELKLLTKLEGYVREVMPYVDMLLKKLGIKGGVQIAIHQSSLQASNSKDPMRAWATIEKGTINFGLKEWAERSKWAPLNRDLKTEVFHTIMHELGHLLTFHFYHKLPTYLKEKLAYGYQQALIVAKNDRIERGQARLNITQNLMDSMETPNLEQRLDSTYYIRFMEWLAEQFRRWSMGSQTMLSELEKTFADVARQMNEVYSEWASLGNGTLYGWEMQEPSTFFSSVMEYLRHVGDISQSLQQYERHNTLTKIGQPIYDSPQLVELANLVTQELSSMAIVPKDLEIYLDDRLDPNLAPTSSNEALGRHIVEGNWRAVELAIGALHAQIEARGMNPKQQREIVRQLVSHEVVHELIARGVITNSDIQALREGMAKQGFELKSHIRESIRTLINKMAMKYGWDLETTELKYNELVMEEEIAYYVQQFANTGYAYPSAAPILQKILYVLRRLAAAIRQKLGYINSDDILRAIFTGEMNQRYENDARKLRRQGLPAVEVSGETLWPLIEQIDKVIPVDQNINAEVEYVKDGNDVYRVNYVFKGLQGERIGFVTLVKKLKGWDVQYIAGSNIANGLQYYDTMLNTASQDLGTKLLPSGLFTEIGYRLFKRRSPEIAKYYRKDQSSGYWMSPHKLMEQLELWQQMLAKDRVDTQEAGKNPDMTTLATEAYSKGQVKRYQSMLRTIPAEFWDNDIAGQMFSLPDNEMKDGVQMALTQSGIRSDERQMDKIMEDGNSSDPLDAFTRDYDNSKREEAASRAWKLGLSKDEVAGSTSMTKEMNWIFDWYNGHAGNSAEAKKHLTGIENTTDHMNVAAKNWWGLSQLVRRNEHLDFLVNYKSNVELMYRSQEKWMPLAQNVIDKWRQVAADPKQAEAINEYVFWATEMKYLLPHEAKRGVIRQPWPMEIKQKQKDLGMSPEASAVVQEINKSFQDYLNAVHNAAISNIKLTITTPEEQMAAMAKLNKDMFQLRSKPYFPMTRFGKFTITVRGPGTRFNPKGPVLWFSSYDKASQRDAAVSDVAAKFRGKSDYITTGTVPENVMEFMGLPPPLLDYIKDHLPGVTIDQKLWIEEFARQNLPDNTFRKKWLPQRSTPGASQDAMRAYAQYFLQGAKYLSRLEYGRVLQGNIAAGQKTVDHRWKNSTKRQMVVDWMARHFKYIMTGGNDWSRFKSYATVWQLGYSVAAAGMNLTQVMVLTHRLSSYVGVGKAYAQLNKGLKAMRSVPLRQGDPGVVGGSAIFKEAHNEMIKQGRIDVGQATELAAYTQQNNLQKLDPGTKAQQAWRSVSYAGMWMFSKVERWNREWSMLAAWQVAQDAKNNPKIQKRFTELETMYGLELTQLEAQYPTWSRQDALSFLFARDIIDESQFTYALHERPQFLRGGTANALLMFFQYTQSMMYAFRWNGSMMHLLLVYMFLYGLQGLPGSDDLNEILKLLGKKIFGKDWDLHKAARQFVHDLTTGTPMETIGPDLIMHGVSRYGFGLGLIPEIGGFFQFDASANGSMGRLVPGLSEALHAFNGNKDANDTISEATQRLAGAGFGPFFALMKYMTESAATPNSHKWEGLFPRAAKAVLKAQRFYSEEAETSRTGARKVSFNPRDPEDLATIAWQAAGFSPTKVNKMWEYERALGELIEAKKTERGIIYAQALQAAKSKDPQAMEAVRRAAREYNESVKDLDPGLAIKNSQQITGSVKSKLKGVELEERFIPRQKGAIPTAGRLQKLYGVEPPTLPQKVR